jgi:hypothetical protein
VGWIGLAKDRNRWRALVNSVLNLRVPRNAGKLSSGLSISVQLVIIIIIIIMRYVFILNVLWQVTNVLLLYFDSLCQVLRVI